MTMYIHCAPLERGNGSHHDSIDISLLWSEKIRRVVVVVAYLVC